MATVGIVGNRKGFAKEYVMAVLDKALSVKPGQDKVISGGANGVDTYAMEWARTKGVPFKAFFPDFTGLTPTSPKASYGPRYMARNTEIAKACDLLVAFNEHTPSGTLNTINTATKLGKEVLVIGKDFPL
jgi:predicted Rossmann fold nucleotide-binding protein DprA/Smf involved in DNA uptake